MRRAVLLFLLCFVFARADAAEPPPRKFVVFFQEWSARLDDAALAVISDAGGYATTHPGVVVHVEGFADPIGSRKQGVRCTIPN